MENIATPLPAKSTSGLAALGQPLGQARSSLQATDRALFDAFMVQNNPQQQDKKKAAAPEFEAEKSAAALPDNSVATTKPVAKKPLAVADKAEPVTQDNTPLTDEEEADEVEVVAIDQPRLVQVITKALEDPSLLAKAKKILGLDEAASIAEVAEAVVAQLPAMVAAIQNQPENAPAEAAAPGNSAEDLTELVKAIGTVLASEIQKLGRAENKVRDTLQALAAIGATGQDDELDALVSRTVNAIDSWKAALAALDLDNKPAATAPADEKTKIVTPQLHATPHPLAADEESLAQPIATGGRSDANLVNNQASAGQTLPLLPTQLTGGQQRLPVATHSALGGSNLDVIARPIVGNTLDAAGKLAKAAARQPASLPQVYEQVSVRLNRMAKNGDKAMTIQLNPSELGRVEVKLDFSKDAAVTARITADNQQTLDLLQRDSKALERALADAGLKLNNDSLQFDLRQGSDSQHSKFAESFKDQGRLWQQTSASAPLVADEIIINVSPAATAADGRVDIQV